MPIDTIVTMVVPRLFGEVPEDYDDLSVKSNGECHQLIMNLWIVVHGDMLLHLFFFFFRLQKQMISCQHICMYVCKHGSIEYSPH